MDQELEICFARLPDWQVSNELGPGDPRQVKCILIYLSSSYKLLHRRKVLWLPKNLKFPQLVDLFD